MVKSIVQVERSMQPVVELRKDAGTFTYGVRAPRAGGVVPPVSYNEGGFTTLAACLLHIARGLGGNFPRIYVRLEGRCVGERDISELRIQPDLVGKELQASFHASRDAQQPRLSLPTTEALAD